MATVPGYTAVSKSPPTPYRFHKPTTTAPTPQSALPLSTLRYPHAHNLILTTARRAQGPAARRRGLPRRRHAHQRGHARCTTAWRSPRRRRLRRRRSRRRREPRSAAGGGAADAGVPGLWSCGRRLIAELVCLYRESDLGMRLPAYDGRNSLYTAGTLPFDVRVFVVRLTDEDSGTGVPRGGCSCLTVCLVHVPAARGSTGSPSSSPRAPTSTTSASSSPGGRSMRRRRPSRCSTSSSGSLPTRGARSGGGGSARSRGGRPRPSCGEDEFLLTPAPRLAVDRNDDRPELPVLLSRVYKSEKIEVSEDRLTVAGTKGTASSRRDRLNGGGLWVDAAAAWCSGSSRKEVDARGRGKGLASHRRR